MLFLSVLSLVSADEFCWKKREGRGIGKVPTECPSLEKSGALCYPPCKKGFKGVGAICYQQCPEGFHNDGLTCRRPHPLKIIGKKQKGRGAGKPLQCKEDEEKDAGLCYRKCGENFHGHGPICWQTCGGDFPVSCGMGCAASSAACRQTLKNHALALKKVVAKLAEISKTDDSNKVNLHTGMTREEIADAEAKIEKQIIASGKKIAQDEAKTLADQIVGHATKGTELDWSKLDVLGLGDLSKAFKNPKC